MEQLKQSGGRGLRKQMGEEIDEVKGQKSQLGRGGGGVYFQPSPALSLSSRGVVMS
jgi:hypothetical protein